MMQKNIRSILALIWSFASIYMLIYILANYGKEKEILTLIIGIVGGSIVGAIIGYYFQASHKSNNVDLQPKENENETTN